MTSRPDRWVGQIRWWTWFSKSLNLTHTDGRVGDMDGGSSGAHSSGERVNLGHLGPVVAVSVVRTSRSVFDGVFYLVARLISVALELIDAGEPDHYGGENNQTNGDDHRDVSDSGARTPVHAPIALLSTVLTFAVDLISRQRC